MLYFTPTLSTHLVSHNLPMCVCSCVQFFVTPWTVARQDPLSMGFSKQEYWTGLPFPSPGNIPDPGIEPEQVGSLPLEPWIPTGSP